MRTTSGREGLPKIRFRRTSKFEHLCSQYSAVYTVGTPGQLPDLKQLPYAVSSGICPDCRWPNRTSLHGLEVSFVAYLTGDIFHTP